MLREHGRLGKEGVLLYSACLASALGELHSKKWAYRDLKAENVVLVRRGQVGKGLRRVSCLSGKIEIEQSIGL